MKAIQELTQELQIITWTPTLHQLQFNRPKQYNAITHQMSLQIYSLLEGWNRSTIPKPNILLFTGHPHVFSSGGDIKECLTGLNPSVELTYKQIYEKECQNTYHMASADPLKIAVWEGMVMGYGAALSLNSEYRIVTQNTVFSAPEINIGIYPDVGISYNLARLQNNPKLGLYLGMTASKLKGEELIAYGLATHLIPSQKITDFLKDLHHLSESIGSSTTKDQTKQKVADLICNYCVTFESSIQNYDEINHIFDIEHCWEIIPQIQKLKKELPSSSFVKRLEEVLVKSPTSSPLAVALSFELIHEATKLTREQLFKYDFHLMFQETLIREFKEGVDSMMIRKDKDPKWGSISILQAQQQLSQIKLEYPTSNTLNLEL